MRILALLNKFPFGVTDGGSAVSRALAVSVRAIDPDATIVTPDTQKHPFQPALVPPALAAPSWQAISCATHLHPRDFLKATVAGRSYHLWRYQRPASEFQLRWYVEQNGPDVCILEGMAGLAFLPFIRRYFPNLPCLYYAHNVEWKVWESLYNKIPAWKPQKWLYKQLYLLLQKEELQALRLATGVSGVSAEDVRWFSEVGGIRALPVWYPGLWERLPEPRAPEYRQGSPLRLYHLGSMDWKPTLQGISYFIRNIWPGLKRAIPEAELHLAGAHMPKSWFTYGIPGLFVQGRVECPDQFLADKHACVVPVFAGSGIKIKVVEAMAYGKPVITTKVGAAGLPILPGQHYLQAESPGEFEAAVRTLRDNPPARHVLALEGRKAIERFFTRVHATEALKKLLYSLGPGPPHTFELHRTKE